MSHRFQRFFKLIIPHINCEFFALACGWYIFSMSSKRYVMVDVIRSFCFHVLTGCVSVAGRLRSGMMPVAIEFAIIPFPLQRLPFFQEET
ncbi:MAG: hypothetical protein IPP25_10045 [Saprospiraceae bacterium]|nr:hypothetical protein [Candidatus Opimibacter skivensis]